ncbi:MAG TPA: FoF1 ATP synthase subunit gamma, partial [Hyphomicrobiales bacterium]|nr:FoF1 ATP synthase subunit gamma [Hyphomicrobiales bacterium]
METRARLTARIASLSEFRELIRAMRALAASHVQEAQLFLPNIRKYSGQIETAIVSAATLLPQGDGHIAPPPLNDDRIVIALCSEQGLSGAYSSEILKAVQPLLAGGTQLGLVGRKGALLAEERDMPMAWSLPMATHAPGVSTLCLNMMNRIAGFSHVTIVFAEYSGSGRYEVRRHQLAPLEPRLFDKTNGEEKPFHYLAPEKLLAKLTLEYVFAELMRAVMEAFAS